VCVCVCVYTGRTSRPPSVLSEENLIFSAVALDLAAACSAGTALPCGTRVVSAATCAAASAKLVRIFSCSNVDTLDDSK
jgi:hypothetical protein